MIIRLADIEMASPVALAPLAGITDLPFRRLVSGFGAGLVVSEMIASREVVHAQPQARARAELGLGEAATAVQLAGRDPYWMAEAAKLVEGLGARVIDINMGCPAKKVTQGLAGSALLRDLPLALRLIEAVTGAVSLPVTLKTRLGWDEGCLNAADLARMAEAAGLRMITIHGRTRQQFYKGRADWGAIAAVKRAVSIPVLANGDIVDEATARAALAGSGADGVMIGRGAQGRPWMPALIAHRIYGAPAPRIPDASGFFDMVAGHYEAMLSFYGAGLGLRVARKHLGWYMDEAATPAALRREVLVAATPRAVLARLPAALERGVRERGVQEREALKGLAAEGGAVAA